MMKPISENMLIVLPATKSPDEDADERQRQRRHDGERLQETAELRGEHDVDEDDRHCERNYHVANRLLHGFGVAAEADTVAVRQVAGGGKGFQNVCHFAKRSSGYVGRNQHLAAIVDAADFGGCFHGGDIGDLIQTYQQGEPLDAVRLVAIINSLILAVSARRSPGRRTTMS